MMSGRVRVSSVKRASVLVNAVLKLQIVEKINRGEFDLAHKL
ncbi:MAG: hypothetical protein ROM54_06160 [Anaerobiospirillum sp.]|nr:hypothetical protein [Anaerobiospirillum sp.]